jgi:hypothetical protein
VGPSLAGGTLALMACKGWRFPRPTLGPVKIYIRCGKQGTIRSMDSIVAHVASAPEQALGCADGLLGVRVNKPQTPTPKCAALMGKRAPCPYLWTQSTPHSSLSG